MEKDKKIFRYIPSGDSAFIIKAGDVISVETNRIIRKLLVKIERENIEGVLDYIPSYNELMICYNPFIIGYRKLLDKLKQIDKDIENIELNDSVTIEIPVCYGGEYGPDLPEVARLNNITEYEVVQIHSSTEYLVFMLGFTPGFCYLGGMDNRIATPRKNTPRLMIPAGAVGIADKQTGIYPIESPGGWQLIGQTPVRLFDPAKEPEFLINPGDYIRFVSIPIDLYSKISSEVNKGTYLVNKCNRT